MYALYAIGVFGMFTARKTIGIIDPMPRDDGAERVIIPLSRRLLDRIDDFRFGHRIPSRAAAIRRLIDTGLKHEKPPEPRNSKR